MTKYTPSKSINVDGNAVALYDPFARRPIEQGTVIDLSKLSNPHKQALMRLVKSGDLVEAKRAVNKNKRN